MLKGLIFIFFLACAARACGTPNTPLLHRLEAECFLKTFVTNMDCLAYICGRLGVDRLTNNPAHAIGKRISELEPLTTAAAAAPPSAPKGKDWRDAVRECSGRVPDDKLNACLRANDHACHDNWPIRWAAKEGCAEVVRLLLKADRVDPAANDNSPIYWASYNGHSEVVKLLLADGRADPAIHYNGPIQLASKYGRSNVVKLLLADPRVDPSDDGNLAIRVANRRNHNEVVKLLAADPRVDIPSVCKSTFFRWVCFFDDEIVKMVQERETVKI